MISKLSYIITENTVLYQNLALSSTWDVSCGRGECILYLWQNRHTVKSSGKPELLERV